MPQDTPKPNLENSYIKLKIKLDQPLYSSS